MNRTAKIATWSAAALVVAGLAVGAGSAVSSAINALAPATAEAPDPTPIPEPSPTHVTELPEWAQSSLWLIYPDGFKCSGTEGCPNDYRAFFGEPGPVLPAHVEYYDPAKHDCKAVRPADMDCGIAP